jgi:drug/metabolite transporter (DMT)-like permease
MVPLVSLVLYRRVPPLSAWMGIALAVAGLFALTGPSEAAGSQTFRGDLLTLGCAVAYAFHITLTGYYSPHCRVSAMVAVQLWVVALLSAACAPLGTWRLAAAPALWAAVLYTGILGSAGAISVQSWAQARTSAIRAAIIYALEPVFATAYSTALGRESVGRRELLGGALVVGGVLTAEVGAALRQRSLQRRAAALDVR